MASTLKPALWIIVACGVSLAIALTIVADDLKGEVIAGMAGPLVAVVSSWLLIDRSVRRDPSSSARRMLEAFAVKALFFGVYVVVALQVFEFDAGPFIASFTCYFVVLYLIEASMFRRLFASVVSPAVQS